MQNLDMEDNFSGILVSAPTRGYIHGKTCIKSDLKEIVLKLATNGQSDKGVLLTSTFVPKGCLPVPWGYIHV